MVQKTADMICPGDIIMAKEDKEHLVLRVSHKDNATRLRTVDMATGVPQTRVWKHTRSYSIDDVLSTLLVAA